MDRNMAAMFAKAAESDRLVAIKLAQLKELAAGMTFRPDTPKNTTTPEKSYDYSEWSPTPITISIDFEPTVFASDASFSYTRSPTHSPVLALPSAVAEWDHPASASASASTSSLSAVAESDPPSSASASSLSPASSSLRDEDIAALKRFARNVQTNILAKSGKSLPPSWEPPSFTGPYLAPDSPRPPSPPLRDEDIEVLQRFARNVQTNILSKSGKSLPPTWEPPSFTGPYLAPSSPRPPSPPPPRPKRVVRISRRTNRLLR
ncbi:hypothetical protein CGLO_04590 [Colletotrichum gloeosporioides Cg-14]|uniref:Uncharacterized protein n=1 Tax=Colletotrichum gloeosporioides (strain Cg-14) TaxID=1237896 RepID=T0KTS8_COLGC|nr:hypothetical protein CGLO_04590 [Colletotrichum gloeosporioides Cg-14]